MSAKPKTQYDFNKLQKRLRRLAGEAIVDYNMIEDGDRVMVCLVAKTLTRCSSY